MGCDVWEMERRWDLERVYSGRLRQAPFSRDAVNAHDDKKCCVYLHDETDMSEGNEQCLYAD